MSGPVSSEHRGTAIRAAVLTALGALVMTAAVSMWTGDRAVFAAAKVLDLRSTSIVGPSPGATLSPARRLDPPLPVATSPELPLPIPSSLEPAQPVNRSTCRNDLSGAVMTITIPDISYICPVYAGGQTMLDSGAATLITDAAIMRVLADHPGGPGLLWVAGHRSSHGGAFAAVPDLADGATIAVTDGTYSATYRVVGRLYVTVSNNRVIDASGHATGEATLDSIIRPDHGGNGAARLLLQTCDGDTHRWMIYADLVTG
ncbi:MAG: sortase domain-containing protein [Ilumatobacteraceae bacterium]